uniref:Uncharacterized protein n=1 Tax=Oryza punctata TaxID=4537 RepID=A0A0E0LU90_ORYPU
MVVLISIVNGVLGKKSKQMNGLWFNDDHLPIKISLLPQFSVDSSSTFHHKLRRSPELMQLIQFRKFCPNAHGPLVNKALQPK